VVVAASSLGVAAGVPLLALAAPAIGGVVGTMVMGLHGAAAVNAGLAALGHGALAAGGWGIAGGTSVLMAGGGALGGAGVGTAAALNPKLTAAALPKSRLTAVELLKVEVFTQEILHRELGQKDAVRDVIDVLEQAIKIEKRKLEELPSKDLDEQQKTIDACQDTYNRLQSWAKDQGFIDA
jgi:hypothetical protein